MDVAGDDSGAGAASGAAAAAVRPDGVLLEQLMDLLDRPLYTMSGPDLDELLQLIEEESKMEVDSPPPPAAAATAAPAAAAAGRPAGAGAATATWEKYEWVKVPAPVVQHERLRLLCSVLRLEACSDNSFQQAAAQAKQDEGEEAAEEEDAPMTSPAVKGKGKAPAHEGSGGGRPGGRAGIPPVVVNLNSSSSELKLLRVLQTLVNLSGKDTDVGGGYDGTGLTFAC
ncbi:hypothetical protein Esi_1133_0001 [Ectocarpus siliculosus]|uniref:Uncharacterized protein n=1 Tax=Ectocarpus siliculosus TaxID=2880 RepID=D7FHV8_ECTSI|nr:hypothetical protein Esi_1133_0001 [Ectocarpus siliculosus]|eukprot:CBJ34156.1 hypothetical protein Esi_1133_0001 [Ectocarpus siliculosus]